jgi:predicted short-subunit dehydrogenase-like oxidoreductase (DUF2520 family)
LDLSNRPLRLCLVGAGRVGTAVTELLRAAGHEVVGICSRTAATAEAAASLVGGPVLGWDDPLPAADLYLIGAVNEGIGAAATRVAAAAPDGRVVCHFSGSLGLGPLDPAAAAGALVAALHPAQAMPDVHGALERLPGSAWGITCGSDLEGWCSELVTRDLRGIPVLLAEERRPLWHAAAVVTSNGVAALLATGESLLRSAGVEAPERVVGPLARGAIANAEEGGGGAATLTGPVVRGEDDALAAHLTVLADHAPELVPPYRAFLLGIVAAAEATARLDAHRAARLREQLESSRSSSA